MTSFVRVPGGDADTLAGLVTELTEDFTVTTYDRRGLSRGTVDAPPSMVPITIHADDARWRPERRRPADSRTSAQRLSRS